MTKRKGTMPEEPVDWGEDILDLDEEEDDEVDLQNLPSAGSHHRGGSSNNSKKQPSRGSGGEENRHSRRRRKNRRSNDENGEDEDNGSEDEVEGDEEEDEEDDEEDYQSMEFQPLNILYYTFNLLCKQYRVKKGTEDLKNLFGYWTDEIGLDNVHLYPSIKVINLRDAYLGAQQLMVLADILRVENMEATRPPSRALRMLKNMDHPPTSFKVSRLPEVLAISLRGMCLDFNVDDRAKFHVYGHQTSTQCEPLPSTPIKVGGNEALRYFLHAITGHPSLEVLDLRHNAIGPHLVPALSRCIKGTPTLHKVKLQHTLLSADEIEMLNAQCLLNQLRREAMDPRLVDYLRELWHEMEVDWLRQLSEKLLAQYKAESMVAAMEEGDISAMLQQYEPAKIPSLFHSVSPYIRIVDPPNEVVAALERYYAHEMAAGSESDESMLLMDRPNTRAGANHRLEALEVGKTKKYSHLFNTPYMRYYKGNEKSGALSLEAEEVLRSAFVDPHVAEVTFLRGRKPCPTLPSCKMGTAVPSSSATLSPSTVAMLKEQVSNSLLMTAIRRVLFPPPEKPKSLLHGIGENDPNLRTTAEENYVTVVSLQERQWNYIVDKLVSHMRLVEFDEGESAYEEGELPYWLFFLPRERAAEEERPVQLTTSEHYGLPSSPSSPIEKDSAPGDKAAPFTRMDRCDSGSFTSPNGRRSPVDDNPRVEVTLTTNVSPYSSPNNSSTDDDDLYEEDEDDEDDSNAKKRRSSNGNSNVKVKEGEFFGDRELFGTTALYIHQHSRMNKMESVDLGLLREKYKYREGLALLSRNRPSSASSTQLLRSDMSPRSIRKKAARKPIAVYQIPFEVAFFYLFEPYQRFHIQAAQATQILPATRNLHPSIASMLGYILHPYGLTAADVTARLEKEKRSGALTIGRHHEVESQTFILEEGEYVLTSISPSGKGIEKVLTGGTVVTNTSAYAIDLKRRMSRRQTRGSHAPVYQPPQVVGKQAALRQYRDLKMHARRNQHRRSEGGSSGGREDDGEDALATSTLRPGLQISSVYSNESIEEDYEFTLTLGLQASHWRYYVIRNEDWFCLPEDVRVALSEGCVVAGQR